MSPSLAGALVGFGGVAERGHLPGYRRDPRFAIHAVCDPDPQARERARRALGEDVALYADVDALLADERLDFVDVASPPGDHLPALERAFAAGLHVLVEKPLALDPEQARRAHAAADAAERALVVVHNWHHAPAFRTAREAIAEGAIGAPRAVEFVTERTQPAGGAVWRLDARTAGGGILVDHGWHQLYLAGRLLGDPDPVRVSANVETRRWTGANVEDTVDARVEYAGGASARLRLTWAAVERRTRVRVEGDAGALRIEDTRVALISPGGNRELPVDADAPDDSYHATWFPAVLDAFARAMADPRHAHPNRREALWCQTVIDAAYESGRREGEAVDVKP